MTNLRWNKCMNSIAQNFEIPNKLLNLFPVKRMAQDMDPMWGEYKMQDATEFLLAMV